MILQQRQFFWINVEWPKGAKGDGEEFQVDIFSSETVSVCEECSKYGILVSVQGFPQASHVDVARNQKDFFSGIVTPKPGKIVLNTYLNALKTIEK